MARGTEEQEQAAEVGADFPYRTLRAHPAWTIIDKALADLESNDDLELQTARRYVTGYLLQQLAEHGQLPPAIAFRPDAPRGHQPRYRWILQIDGMDQLMFKKPTRRTTSTTRKRGSTRQRASLTTGLAVT